MPLGLIRKVAAMKKAKPDNVKPARVSVDEKRIINEMAKQMIPQHVAKYLRRDPATIKRQLAMKTMVKKGRKEYLSNNQKDKLEQVVVDMVKKADANYMVTLPMIHRRSRLKCSEKTVSRALHLRGYRFFRLYEKMILTPEDIKKRWNWAKKHAGKSRQWSDCRAKRQEKLDACKTEHALHVTFGALADHPTEPVSGDELTTAFSKLGEVACVDVKSARYGFVYYVGAAAVDAALSEPPSVRGNALQVSVPAGLANKLPKKH